MARGERIGGNVADDQRVESGVDPAGARYGEPEGPDRQTGDGGRTGLLAILGVVIVGLLIWAIWATWFDNESRVSGPDVGATVQEIASNPSEYAGSRVVISGQIDQIVAGGDNGGATADGAGAGALTAQSSNAAFTIGQDDPNVLILAENIPQIGALSANEEIATGDIVQVAGTVRTFDVGLAQSTLGDAFDQNALDDFGDNQAIVVANTVRLVPITQQGEQLQVTMSGLLDNPQEFYGEQIAVRNVTLGNQIARQDDNGAFEFGNDETSILILGRQGMTQGLREGAQATLTGTVVEPSTVALVRQLGLANEQDLFSDFGFDDEFSIQDYQAVLVLDRQATTSGQSGAAGQSGGAGQGGTGSQSGAGQGGNQGG